MFKVEGLGCRVRGSGSRVYGLGFGEGPILQSRNVGFLSCFYRALQGFARR